MLGLLHVPAQQDNRDKRVELLQRYARRFFPAVRYLDYALRVEAYTLTKAANLVLNVDGCIGALFLDLLHSSSMFSQVRCCPGDVAVCVPGVWSSSSSPSSMAPQVLWLQLTEVARLLWCVAFPPRFAALHSACQA